MSKSLNKVTLIGNLGADPEVRSLTSGAKVANFSIATSRQWKNGKDEKEEKTEWHRITAWSNPNKSGLADIVEKYCRKGERVYVEGRIEYRSWQDNDGQTKYITDIIANDVILLGSGKKDDAAPAKREGLDETPKGLAGGSEDDDLPFHPMAKGA